MPNYHLSTDKTWTQTRTDLEETMRKWGITRYTIDPVKPAFNPAKRIQTDQERSVTVRYTKSDGVQVVLTSQAQERAVDNFRALYLAIERMRLIDAAGLTDIVRQAYAQLPPPGATPPALTTDDPYAVIGVQRGDSLEGIERVWKARLWEAHPDHGGDLERTARLNAAMDAIRKERSK